MLLLSQNPTGGGTFDKVSYSPRKWSSLRKGVAHSCGKREIMEDISPGVISDMTRHV